MVNHSKPDDLRAMCEAIAQNGQQSFRDYFDRPEFDALADRLTGDSVTDAALAVEQLYREAFMAGAKAAISAFAEGSSDG